MAYASSSDVQDLCRTVGIDFADLDEKVSAATVTTWISQVESQINGILKAQGYSTIPASGVNDVPMLQRFTAEKVAAKVWEVVFANSEFPDVVQRWHRDFDEFILSLRNGKLQLVDQSPQSSDEGYIEIGDAPVRDRRQFFQHRRNEL